MIASRVAALAALLGILLPASAVAAPARLQPPPPSIVVTPGAAAPGQTVHVSASGFAAENQVGATLCLGVLGPGRNVELGLAPSFRMRIGTLTIGPAGTGEADVQLPTNLAGGTYDLVIGGCPPQAGLAPLAVLARAPITVQGPTPTVSYFAEGSTQPPFDTWFLVQNPTPEPASVAFTFSFERGPDLTRTFSVGPNSRLSLYANQLFPDAAFSTRVSSDSEVFVERSMFVGFDGDVVPGIPEPGNVWLFAEGSTQEPFHTWLLLQNPTIQTATATITYHLENEAAVTQRLSLPPTSRTSVFANQVIPGRAFSARVESDIPIVAERAMYRFPGNAAIANVGVTTPSRTWYFADGHSIFLRNQPADTWLLLQNGNSFPVAATATFFSSEGVTLDFPISLPPSSRQSLLVNRVFDQPAYGIRVTASADIIAERSVFATSPATGGEPRGAMAAVGATQLGNVWTFAEGSTASPFSENLVVLNPHDQAMAAHFEFMLENGQVVARDITVEPRRRSEVSVGSFVPPGGVSARVTTSLPSVAERVMFWVKEGNMGIHDAVGIRLPS